MLKELDVASTLVMPLAGKAISPLALKTDLEAANESKRKLLADFLATPLGQVMKTKALQAVARGAKDTAGDERLGSIAKTLSLDAWLRWVPVDEQREEWKLENIETLHSGFLYASMSECLEAVHEAVTTWSDIHRAEHLGEATAALERVLQEAAVVESTCALELHEQLRPPAEALDDAWKAQQTAELNAFVRSEDAVGVWASFEEAVVGPCCSQKLLDGAASLLATAKTVLKSTALANAENKDELLRHVDDLERSRSMRADLVTLCQLMKDLKEGASLDAFISVAAKIRAMRDNDSTFPFLDPVGDKVEAGVEPTFKFGECTVAPDCESPMPSTLVDGGFADAVMELVTTALDATLTNFVQQGMLDYINPVEVDADSSPEDALALLFPAPADRLETSAKAVEAAVNAGQDTSSLPASATLARLDRLVKAAGLEQVDAKQLLGRAPLGSPLRETELVLSVAGTLDVMHRMAMCLASLRLAIPANAWEAQLEDHGLRKHIVGVLEELGTLVEKFTASDFANFADDQWLFSHEVLGFFGASVEHVLQTCRWYFLEVSLRGVDNLCGDLVRKTPPYGSFVNDTTFHPGLARSQLLEWPHKAELAPRAKRLSQIMQEAAQRRSAWKISQDGVAGAGLSATFDTTEKKASETLQAAKKAIAVVAAVDLLEGTGKTGANRELVAGALLMKSSLMPKALIKALKAIAAAPSGRAAAGLVGR